MTTWPNWVDLVIVTIVLKMSYNGFGRGLLAEFLNLLGAVSITMLTINYAGVVASWIQPWVPWGGPIFTAFLLFWVCFFGLLVAVHVMLRRLAEIMKWERLHWALQSLGLMLGMLRGLWWCGVILVALTSSGLTYLHESVEQRSVLGSRLVGISRQGLEQVADRFPGAQHRSKTLFPPVRATAT